MDNRKIKLALTVDLINNGERKNLLDVVKKVMGQFKEVGAFIGEQIIRKSKINNVHEKATYAIQFENCTLDVDLVSDTSTCNQFVQQFHLNKR